MGESNATRDLLWVLGIFVAVGVIWFLTGGPNRPLSQAGPLIKPPTFIGLSGGSDRNPNLTQAPPDTSIPADATHSAWYKQVSISLGNAQSEYQPGSEYIILNARYKRGAPAVNISGWILENGKGNRYFVSGSQTVRGVSERAVIPEATRLIASRDQITPYGPLMLESGGRVAVFSGKPPTFGEARYVAGWLENACSGYFLSSSSGSCPRVESTPGFGELDDNCRQLVRSRVRSCQEPEFGKNREGDTTLNGAAITIKSYCRKYIEEHFNYPVCVKDHLTDTDFFTKNWRVYLGRTWEMWSKQRETITLYDQFGKMVDQISYGS